MSRLAALSLTILAVGAGALAVPSLSQAAGPTAIAADSDGAVYAGYASGAIRRFGATAGEPLTSWPTPVADAEGSLGAIVAIDVGPAGGIRNGGNVWVLDANRRVQEFTRAGAFIRGFRLGPCESSNDPMPGSKGGIDVTNLAVYVAHPCANTVERFDAGELPVAGTGSPPSIAADVYWPHGIAAPLSDTGPVDTQALYVTQPRSSAIRRYDLASLAQIGDAIPITHTGTPDDVFLSGGASEGRVLVSETENFDAGYSHRIYAFGSTVPGSFVELFNFGGAGAFPGQFDGAVAIDAVAAEAGFTSAVVVADRDNERVQRVTSKSSDNGTVNWVSAASDPGPPPVTGPGGTDPTLPADGPVRNGNARIQIDGGARFTATPKVLLTVDEPKDTNSIEIANNAAFDDSQRFPSGSERIDWQLEARAPDRVRRRVFVKFAGSGRRTATDEIRLDRSRPKVRTARTIRAKKNWVLRVVAADEGSGLAEIRIASREAGPYQERSFEPRMILEHRKDARWIKVADLVGNVSGLERSSRRR